MTSGSAGKGEAIDSEGCFDEDRIRGYIAVANSDDEIRRALRAGIRWNISVIGVLAVSIPVVAAIVVGLTHLFGGDGQASQFSNGARIFARFVGRCITPDQAKDAVIPLLATVASINIALSVGLSGIFRRELVNISRWRSQFNTILRFAALVCMMIGIMQWFGVSDDRQRGEALVLSVLTILTVWLAHITISRVDSVGLAEALRDEDQQLQKIAAWRYWLTLRQVPAPDPPFAGSRTLMVVLAGIRFILLPVLSAAIATAIMFAGFWILYLNGQVMVTWKWVADQFPFYLTLSTTISTAFMLYNIFSWSLYGLVRHRIKRWIPNIVCVTLMAALVAVNIGGVLSETGVVRIEYALYAEPYLTASVISLGVIWLSRAGNGRGCILKRMISWLAQPHWNVVWGALQWTEDQRTMSFDIVYERLVELDESLDDDVHSDRAR